MSQKKQKQQTWKKPDLPTQVCCLGLCQAPGCPHCSSPFHLSNRRKKKSVISLLWFWEACPEMCHAHPPEKCPDPTDVILRSVSCELCLQQHPCRKTHHHPPSVQHYPCQATGVNSILQLDLSPGLTPHSVAQELGKSYRAAPLLKCISRTCLSSVR